MNNPKSDCAKVKQHVFIIGSKGIPANYGGFESFVDKQTCYKKSKLIHYHVSCLVEPESYSPHKPNFEFNGANCFNIKAKKIGPGKAIVYDLEALNYCIRYIEKNNIQNAIIYILACRIGPFIFLFKKKIKNLGIHLFVNPDGHEWKRAKWSAPAKQYWKYSEKLMVKHSELIVCDSKNIEKYILDKYKKFEPDTIFISYGADTTKSKILDTDLKLIKWYQEKGIKSQNYYLVVGRFVPENNYETIIREFLACKSSKDLVIITTENDKYLKQLEKKLQFSKDKRIRFVGTVYDQELLKKIRENAFAYLHGHEVGGTNPSLLEALGSTKLNLLLEVGFNREVAEDSALYWNKNKDNLASLIESADKILLEDIEQMGRTSKRRIESEYTWDKIVDQYETLFLTHKAYQFSTKG